MIRVWKGIALLAVLSATFVPALSAEFTQKELEAMVKELDAILPRDPQLEYPIKATVEKSPKVNAYAWLEDQGSGKKPRAIMVVYTGLVDHVKGDRNVIRACVAHEVAHLSRGHVSGFGFIAKDLNNLFTRQMEHEADVVGTGALQKLGYSKNDMIKLLEALEKLDGRKGNWWDKLTADHADSKARIAEIADNPAIMQSLLQFDIGLAFADSRRWNLAGKYFDEAAQKEPKLLEAYVNSAQCALMYYHDLLPREVLNSWLRVDFGPMLMEIQPIARSVAIDDRDRERYRNAMAKIETAITKVGSTRAKELKAIAQILEPDGNKAVMQAGVDALKALANAATDNREQLRYANNACVGLHRLGNLDAGYAMLMSAQKKTTAFNYALGENMGRIIVKTRERSDESLAADVMFTWLQNTSSLAPYWDVVKSSYEASMKKLGETPTPIKPAPIQYCRAGSLWIGGKELGLFRPVAELEAALGAPEKRLYFDERYKDMLEIYWPGRKYSILTERGKVLRLTSYETGSYIFLQPVDDSVTGGFRITVGMTVDELKKILDPATGATKKLIRGGEVEDWTYFEGLAIGLILKDGKVSAITVTPVEYEEKG